jgi:glutamyl-tRNA reductase
LGPKEAKTIEELSYAIVEGILATPMNNLRKEIDLSNENEELKRVVSKLFKICIQILVIKILILLFQQLG